MCYVWKLSDINQNFYILSRSLLLMLIDRNPWWRNWQYASKSLSLLIVECILLTGKNENHAYYIIALYIKLKWKLFEKPKSLYERPYHLPEGLVFLDFSFYLYKVMWWIRMSSHNYFLIPSLSRKIRFAKRWYILRLLHMITFLMMHRKLLKKTPETPRNQKNSK